MHSDLSNPIAGVDSTTKYKKYINKAKELDMKAFAFSEHGNIFEWYAKKRDIENAGMKYIHACEMYITETFSENIRDNYHIILIAKNYQGFLELNKLISISFNRAEIKIIDDISRFYYRPRISYEELKNTSDNIIITSACLGGILASDNNIKEDFISYLTKNKHRSFLEIQHHNTKDQIEYNKYLYNLSKETGIKLIAGTDTHSLTLEDVDARKMLQLSKNVVFESEEEFDITFKSYDDLVKCYKQQNSIPNMAYLEAIENTNLLNDMVENFELDHSFKYPKFSTSPKDELIRLIEEENRENIDWDRVNYELIAIEKNQAYDFFLLEYNLKKEVREKCITYGDSRGSVSGSYIAYLLRITNSHPIKHNYSFERFMNPDRVSLSDVDTDYSPNDRESVKDILYNMDNLYNCEIITFNTIQMRGAIRDICRALNKLDNSEYTLDIADSISKNIEKGEKKFRKKYKKLFRYVDLVNSVITSIGSHPAATVCSPISLEDNVGLITLSTSKYPVSSISMKNIDSLNYVKLDILGLDNIELISKTCELANINILNSTNINDNDEKVWKHITESPIGIFQFTEPFAHMCLSKMLHKDILNSIKSKNPDITNIELMAMVSGVIRPGGDSYRDDFINGIFGDNKYKMLNDFFSSTLGYCIYQEQIIEFLHKFCGFSMGKADIIRRFIAKKSDDKEAEERNLNEIRDGFVSCMKDKYNIDKKESESIIKFFLQIVKDSSSYLFSRNHSKPYAYIGYICGYLRYYYPIEFLTTMLNIKEDSQTKTAEIFEYIKTKTKIKVKPARFRYSRSKYTPSKSDNSIYKGIKSIKECNNIIAEELYSLRNNIYNNFFEVLIDINKKTTINITQLNILIKLDFFEEFGNSKVLLELVKIFIFFKKGKIKQINKTTLDELKDQTFKKIIICNSRETKSLRKDLNIKNILQEIHNYVVNSNLEEYPLKNKLEWQMEYMGYVDVNTGNEEDRIKLIILEIRELNTKDKRKIWGYELNYISIGSGIKSKMVVFSKTYNLKKLKKFDIIKINRNDVQRKEYNGYINYYLYKYKIINI